MQLGKLNITFIRSLDQTEILIDNFKALFAFGLKFHDDRRLKRSSNKSQKLLCEIVFFVF